MNLHLALRTPENWRTVAEVRLDAVASGVSAQVSYDFDYVIERILAVGEGEIGRAAVACGYPVRLEPHVRSHWPRFLDDLMPGGAARRWWVNRLGIADQPPLEQNLRLLSEAAMAPVGHLRVQEAVPPRVGAPLRFPRQAVADRDHGFLDHAAEMGASVGGATGAGGEAPKLLLRLADDGQVWLDTWQDRVTPDRAYLVKFARHRRSAIDRTILRAEYVYWRAVCGSLSGYGPPEGFWESLRQLAEKLQDLPDRLRSLGLAAEVLEHPRLGLLDTRARLRGWGLLP